MQVGCGAWVLQESLQTLGGADGQREEEEEKLEISSVRTGFIPPGATELGWPREKLSRKSYLYHHRLNLNVRGIQKKRGDKENEQKE